MLCLLKKEEWAREGAAMSIRPRFSAIDIMTFVFFYITACMLFAWGFLFAKRPALLEGDEQNGKSIMIPYRRWPRIGGSRVYPIIAIPLLFLFIYDGIRSFSL